VVDECPDGIKDRGVMNVQHVLIDRWLMNDQQVLIDMWLMNVQRY
jgi:hypothetical protein